MYNIANNISKITTYALQVVINSLYQNYETNDIDAIYLNYAIALKKSAKEPLFTLEHIQFSMRENPENLKYKTINQIREAILNTDFTSRELSFRLGEIALCHNYINEYGEYDEVKVNVCNKFNDNYTVDFDNNEILIACEAEIVNFDYMVHDNMNAYSKFYDKYFIKTDINIIESDTLNISKDTKILKSSNQIVTSIINSMCGSILSGEIYNLDKDYRISELEYELHKYKKLINIARRNFISEKSDLVFAFKGDELQLYLYNNCYELYPQQTKFIEEIDKLKNNLKIQTTIYNYDFINYIRDDSTSTHSPATLKEKATNSYAFNLDIEDVIDFKRTIINEFKSILNFNVMSMYGKKHLRFRLNAGDIEKCVTQNNDILLINENNLIIAKIDKDYINFDNYPNDKIAIGVLIDKINNLIF